MGESSIIDFTVESSLGPFIFFGNDDECTRVNDLNENDLTIVTSNTRATIYTVDPNEVGTHNTDFTI